MGKLRSSQDEGFARSEPGPCTPTSFPGWSPKMYLCLPGSSGGPAPHAVSLLLPWVSAQTPSLASCPSCRRTAVRAVRAVVRAQALRPGAWFRPSPLPLPAWASHLSRVSHMLSGDETGAFSKGCQGEISRAHDGPGPGPLCPVSLWLFCPRFCVPWCWGPGHCPASGAGAVLPGPTSRFQVNVSLFCESSWERGVNPRAVPARVWPLSLASEALLAPNLLPGAGSSPSPRAPAPGQAFAQLCPFLLWSGSLSPPLGR